MTQHFKNVYMFIKNTCISRQNITTSSVNFNHKILGQFNFCYIL